MNVILPPGMKCATCLWKNIIKKYQGYDVLIWFAQLVLCYLTNISLVRIARKFPR